jgi:hypothetical protein
LSFGFVFDFDCDLLVDGASGALAAHSRDAHSELGGEDGVARLAVNDLKRASNDDAEAHTKHRTSTGQVWRQRR